MGASSSADESRTNITGLRRIVFALTPTLVVIGVFALGFVGEPENDPFFNASPLWGPGDAFYTHDRKLAHNLADPLLIWRGRPDFDGVYDHVELGVVNRYHHNAFGYRGDEVAVPKPEGVIRVLNLGDSSTWGLNLYEGSNNYSEQLQRILDGRSEAGAPRYDVVNAGVVGYSSLQGLQQLRYHTAALEPDVVTVYLGNNDPTPGSLSDAERIAGAPGPLVSALQHNRFYLLIEKVFFHLQAGRISASREAFQETLRANDTGEGLAGAPPPPPPSRVSLDDYEKNLRDIVEEIRGMGARPLLLDVPVHMAWPARIRPFWDDTADPDGYWNVAKTEPGYLSRPLEGEAACQRSLGDHPYLCMLAPEDLDLDRFADAATLDQLAVDPSAGDADRLRAAHNGAVRELVEGDLERALERFESVAMIADVCACLRPRQRNQVLYNLGITRLLAGREDAAFEALMEARRVWPFAMSPAYSERFQRVVADMDVDWIDLPSLFREADPRFRGSALIHDWVHPNARGSAIIAHAIADELAALD